jgi:steroid delta-isomerase-like uncharacterized protein
VSQLIFNKKKGNPMTQQQFIQSFYDVVNSHDIDKFLECFSDNSQFKTVSTDENYQGKNEIRDMAEKWMKAFPDGKFQVHKIIGSSDNWGVEMSFTGTHQGLLSSSMGDIPATGKKVNVPACDIFTLKNNKIQSVNCYLSVALMLKQLGAMPMERAA